VRYGTAMLDHGDDSDDGIRSIDVHRGTKHDIQDKSRTGGQSVTQISTF